MARVAQGGKSTNIGESRSELTLPHCHLRCANALDSRVRGYQWPGRHIKYLVDSLLRGVGEVYHLRRAAWRTWNRLSSACDGKTKM